MASLKKDDDEDSLDDEFLGYLSGNIPPPNLPPPPPNPPAATTATPTKKAFDTTEFATPPAVGTDYYDANDDTCPRPSAPPLELLMEDGYYDESTVLSSPYRRPFANHDDVAARPHPPLSRAGEGGGGGVRMAGGARIGTGGMVAGEAEGRNRQQPRPTDVSSSGWTMPIPPRSPLSTNTSIDATGVYDPRVESDASATQTVPVARASRVLSDINNMGVCQVVPMMTTPFPAPAQVQAQYNIGEGEERRDRGNGTNDELPGCSIKCGRFVRICLVSLGSVVVGAIIAVIVMMVGVKEDDLVLVPISTAITSTSTTTTTTTSTSATTPVITTDVSVK